MPTLKPVIKGYKRYDGKCKIYIRVIHNSKAGFVPTAYYIEPRAMRKDGTVQSSHSHHAKLTRALNGLLYEYNSILLDLDTRRMTVNEIVTRLRNKDSGEDFFKYANLRIGNLRKEERFSYAESYQVMLVHLLRFLHRETLKFSEIKSGMLEEFEAYLKIRGAKVNTRRIYLNNIRAIFNHALDHDVIQLPTPFRKFKVKQEKTQKRSISVDALRRLRVGHYLPAQQRSVDLFFLSLYLIGINLKDLLYLTPDRVYNGRLEYRRAKTGTLFSVKLMQQAYQIINKYKGKKYLLRFLDGNDSFIHYKCVLKETNKRLKLAGKINGIDNITTYSARHSWASIASDLNVPKEVISMALGHQIGSEMTDVYIKFNEAKIDEANEKVLRLFH